MRRERRERREREPLRVAEVARVLQRDRQGERVARRARLGVGEQLADVADLRARTRRALGSGRPEQPAELLQVRAAARTSSTTTSSTSLERLDQPAGERLALLEPARVHGERAAAALRRGDDLEAVGREHACGGRVHVREHRALDAAGEQPDACRRARPLAGVTAATLAVSSASGGAISASGRKRRGSGSARARAARAGAPPACVAG